MVSATREGRGERNTEGREEKGDPIYTGIFAVSLTHPNDLNHSFYLDRSVKIFLQ